MCHLGRFTEQKHPLNRDNKRPRGLNDLLDLLPDETSIPGSFTDNMDNGKVQVAEVTYLQSAVYF